MGGSSVWDVAFATIYLYLALWCLQYPAELQGYVGGFGCSLLVNTPALTTESESTWLLRVLVSPLPPPGKQPARGRGAPCWAVPGLVLQPPRRQGGGDQLPVPPP